MKAFEDLSGNIVSSELLQYAFRYGDPVLVIFETFDNITAMANDSKLWKAVLSSRSSLTVTIWWKAVNTTRTLLAHAVFLDSRDDLVVGLLANIRNLIRIVGVDIADKAMLRDLQGNDAVHFVPLKYRKKNGCFFHFDVNKIPKHEILSGLVADTYSHMESEIRELMKRDHFINYIVSLFGRAVYELLGTRDNLWASSTRKYQDVSDDVFVC